MNMIEEPAIYAPDASDKPFAGLVREWYLNRTVVLYRLIGVSSDIVDRWSALVLETLHGWDKATPYLAVHDLAQAGVSLQFAALVGFDLMNVGVTLEGRMAADEILNANPGFKGLVAANFNLSLSGQTNRTLMNFLQPSHPAVRYKSFYNRNKAIRWLAQGGLSDTKEVKASQLPANDNHVDGTSGG